MTDAQVLDGVARAKRAYKSAETKARREYAEEKKRVFAFFGSSDVERAARENALLRAESYLDAKLAAARITLINKLEALRAVAGEWADLVPVVRA